METKKLNFNELQKVEGGGVSDCNDIKVLGCTLMNKGFYLIATIILAAYDATC